MDSLTEQWKGPRQLGPLEVIPAISASGNPIWFVLNQRSGQCWASPTAMAANTLALKTFCQPSCKSRRVALRLIDSPLYVIRDRS